MRKLILLAALLAATQSFSLVVFAQKQDYTGKYIFKDYRKGKGGYENHLEITTGSNGRLHVSFELTYFYMAGRSETFHEGSAEGDGQLKGNVLTATLSDGENGSCKITMTFLATPGAVSVKSGQCQINVVPDGIYQKEAVKTASPGRIAAPRPVVPGALVQHRVCPDPKQPCNSKARTFAPYEISFQLPGKLARGKTYNSLPFYAVLIKSFAEESCDADDHTESIERERKKIQLDYPYNKVFASYSCPNLDAVDYSFAGLTDATGERVLIMTFIAVYAGETEAKAREFLGYVKTVYPQAKLKLMTASYGVMDQ
jgi:hypothetical protein